MSEQTTEQPAPLMEWNGQPWSREMARDHRIELLAKPEYAKAFDNNDTAKLVELKDLWMLERGLVPSPPPAEDVADVELQALDRDQRIALQHAAAVRQRFGLSDEEAHQIVQQRPISQEEKDLIAEQHARNMRDEAFRERLLRQDPGALKAQYIANAIKVAPLARSQADIDTWTARHPFTPRS
jgi:hypothetical protein